MDDRLAHASSPYLRQHAGNPVDWYPWGDEPFEAALQRNVPVFISIGYAACHWCHVMAHECFEDAEVGKALNESFVSIKVDREEHPAVDHFYLSAASAMGVRGGWPLTVLATPDRRPFYCATYLPKESRPGQMGFLTLLERVSSLWSDRPQEISQFGAELVDLLQRAERADRDNQTVDSLSPVDLKRAYSGLRDAFDEHWGGFSHAPKFPSPHQLTFLLRYGNRFDDVDAVEMTRKTLDRMLEGGICDQIGGGFHRYATDRKWMLPHFEKMLVDQALLLHAYAEMAAVTRQSRYERACEGIVSYLERDLRSPGGAFYASEDADSEGSEGRFYLWSWQELALHLSAEERIHVQDHWGVIPEGNVHDEATGQPTRLNLFHGSLPPGDGRAEQLWYGISSKLLAVRSERVRPMRDEKILTDWNGAVVAALSFAGRKLGISSWVAMADQAARHVIALMRQKEGRMAHSWFEGHLVESETLDDYANLIWACIELFQATSNPEWLTEASGLADSQISLFWDTVDGGFFLSPSDETGIPVRQKAFSDGATHSAASMSALNLLKLSTLLDMPEYERLGRIQLEQAASMSKAFRMGFSATFSSVDYLLGPRYEIVIIRGNNGTRLFDAVNAAFIPNALVWAVDASNRPLLEKTMPHINDYVSIGHQETAYICVERACQLPITELSDLTEAIALLRAH